MSTNSRSLVIGCPIHRREWIIDKWLEHTLVAADVSELDYKFLFIADEEDPTLESIDSFCRANKIEAFFHHESDSPEPIERSWTEKRYHRMVDLRNKLLQRVRDAAPDFFLSVDSDILLHSKTIVNLIEALDFSDKRLKRPFSAVGGKTYMTVAGTHAPSYGMFKRDGSGLLRKEADGVFRVDAIMAIKLMNSEAYNVDYGFDRRGEDIAWSRNCKEAGLTLGWDGRVASKHVMRPHLLDRVDKRVGW